MNSFYYQKELQQLNDIFEAASKMTDEEVQQAWNCNDTREEFLEYTQEEIDRCQELYDEAVEEEEREEMGPDWETAGLDPAFRSWKEYFSMFI